jgi:hypothetical protein
MLYIIKKGQEKVEWSYSIIRFIIKEKEIMFWFVKNKFLNV